MKRFEPFSIDFEQCRVELLEFKKMLDAFESRVLKERKHVLSFFRKNRNIAALVGHLAPRITKVDLLAYEFDFFGDYAADLAIGDSREREYYFIEFENAAPNSIFRKVGRKSSLEWSPSFDHGYSQIIDWFWKLYDMAGSETGRSRFGGVSSFDYYGILIIGRDRGLAEIEKKRLNWRRKKVMVDSKHVYCMTFDELYEELVFLLEKRWPAAIGD